MSASLPGNRVPANRLAQVIHRWVTEGGSHASLAELAGIDKRHIRGIVHGDREFVLVATADRLLVAMDMWDLWHLTPEMGGLSDVYFHESVVGAAA